jgi:hypothetical protein
VRLAAATVSVLGAAVLMRSWNGDVPAALWIPTAFLFLSALLLHHGALGSQLVARSAWWASLVLGTLIAVTGHSSSDGWIGVLLAVTAGTALMAMGRLGLDEGEGSAFRPVAFRTTLTLGMIMAVADAQALALFGALKVQEGAGRRVPPSGGPRPPWCCSPPARWWWPSRVSTACACGGSSSPRRVRRSSRC